MSVIRRKNCGFNRFFLGGRSLRTQQIRLGAHWYQSREVVVSRRKARICCKFMRKHTGGVRPLAAPSRYQGPDWFNFVTSGFMPEKSHLLSSTHTQPAVSAEKTHRSPT